MPIHVLLAEDHELVRQGLKALLSNEGFLVVAEAADGLEAVHLAQERKPDVAVLDFSMPKMNGVEAAGEIMGQNSGTRTVILTQHEGEAYCLEALRAGVHGYVIKSEGIAELGQAIRDVSEGQLYVSPSLSPTLAAAFRQYAGIPTGPLTARERDILQLIAEGNTSKEIAAALDISDRTAESYRSRIMVKVGVKDIAGLVRYAIRLGLLVP
ncbi:MAG TPA: response regulator transcription factor [Candidatus Cryosericum sp.]|nr:response regulator transcription factor [Candidatus Cryosericum sp.]